MSSRNERLNENLISLDEFLGQFNDESKIAALLDGGKGTETMLKILDYDPKEESDEIVKENNEYVSLLIFKGNAHLVRTRASHPNCRANRQKWQKSPRVDNGIGKVLSHELQSCKAQILQRHRKVDEHRFHPIKSRVKRTTKNRNDTTWCYDIEGACD